jgi:hypothetical protein
VFAGIPTLLQANSFAPSNKTIMKKKIILAATLFLSVLAHNNLHAQSAEAEAFGKGTNVLNAGIGLGSFGLSGSGGFPIVASFEHGFSQNISAGLQGGLVQRTFGSDWKYSYLFIGARGSYHFNNALKIANPKLDVYGGIGLTYRRFSVKYKGEDGSEPDIFSSASSGDVIFNLHAGGRYLFANNLGAFAELGYGISPLQLGLTLKF